MKSHIFFKFGCLGSFDSDLKKTDGGAKALAGLEVLGVFTAVPCFPILLKSLGWAGLLMVEPKEGGLIGLGI